MRAIVVILVFVAIAAVVCVEPEKAKNRLKRWQKRDYTPEERLKFREWRLRFSRKYRSLNEEEEARLKMLVNKEKIDAHNKLYAEGKVTFKRGLWKHSDMSLEEKEKFLIGGEVPRMSRSGPAEPILPQAFPTGPASINWVERGLVGPVEEQGWCGSCWAYSSKGVVEALLRRKNITTPVSPQQMVDCSKWSCNGCRGGWPASAIDYLRDNGFTSAKQYPYLGYDHTCYYNKSMAFGSINKTHLVWTDGNETMLRDIVASVGPVSIMMRIEESFYNYESGVYYEPNCGKHTNHCMLLVGYGTDPVGGDYWLIKNSWGDSWGDWGYVKFARNRGNQCNIAHSATYAS